MSSAPKFLKDVKYFKDHTDLLAALAANHNVYTRVELIRKWADATDYNAAATQAYVSILSLDKSAWVNQLGERTVRAKNLYKFAGLPEDHQESNPEAHEMIKSSPYADIKQCVREIVAHATLPAIKDCLLKDTPRYAGKEEFLGAFRICRMRTIGDLAKLAIHRQGHKQIRRIIDMVATYVECPGYSLPMPYQTVRLPDNCMADIKEKYFNPHSDLQEFFSLFPALPKRPAPVESQLFDPQPMPGSSGKAS